METRPSSSSVAKSPVLLSTSASASFTSHLSVSSSSSQRRLRALCKPDSDELPRHDKQKFPAVLRSLPSSPQTSELPLHNSEKAAYSKSHSVRLAHWLLIGYCLLSVTYFTVRLFGIPDLYAQNQSQEVNAISPVNSMTLPYRLSKLLQSEPGPVSFAPFVSSARLPYHKRAITACVWIEEEGIQNLETWASKWDGPLSIVVVVGSSQDEVGRVNRQIENLPTIKNKAYLHLVQRRSNETLSVNSYLNLARLFAQTRFVVLFPAEPLSQIPNNLYQRLVMHTDKLNVTRRVAPQVLSPSKIRPNNPVPFPPLSPLLLDQSYPIWCSERFFSVPSRGENWEECLWQFWLNSYGHLSTLPGAGWKVPSTRKKTEVGTTTTSKEIIHRRLSNRFRHESCVLAAKRLKDTSVDPTKVDARKAHWLRRTCKQVMTTWAKELL